MIYITGDLHGDPEGLFVKPFQKHLQAGDYLIICGDFGLVWGGRAAAYHKYWLDLLATKPYTVLFVDGNHENFEMLNALPVEEYCGGRVHRIRKNVLHMLRGEIFNLAGRSFFCFGGASSIDKAMRSPYLSWWPEELPNEAEFNHALASLQQVDFKVDYVVTHTAPEQLFLDAAKSLGLTRDYCPVRLMLNQLAAKITYKAWFFGHMHLDLVNSRQHYYWLFHDVLQLDSEGKIRVFYTRKK